jgi:predicted Zn finger-like uncharacterized protein
MIITCEACGTSFRLKTGRVKETGSKVRCSKCQHVFVVYPPAALADRNSVSGVEGTATMEFFGALEAEARSAREDEARRRREDDNVLDFQSSAAMRGGGKDRIFDESEAAASGATADLSLSELEYDTDQDFVSYEDLETSPQMEAASNLTDLVDDSPGVSEPGRASSVDDWSVVEDTLDIENLTVEPEAPAVSTHEFDEMDAEAVSAQDEGVYGLADIEEPPQETQEESGEAEPEGIIDFSDIARTSQGTLDFEDQEFEAFAEEDEEGKTPAAEIEPKAGVDHEEEDLDVDAYTVMADSVDFREASEDLTAELEAGNIGEDDDLDLDLDDDLAFGEEIDEEIEETTEREMEFDLDLGEEETSESVLDASTDDFDLDLDFEESVEEPSGGEREEREALDLDGGIDEGEMEMELDLDFGEEEPSEPVLDATADEFDLELDLEGSIEEPSGGEREEREALDLDGGTGEEPAEPIYDTVDGDDWALDMDEFDLDLDEEGMESVDLDSTEFDLDFDLMGDETAARKESPSKASAKTGYEAEPEPPLGGAAEDEGFESIDLEEEDLDLDFDFDEDEEQAAAGSAALDEQDDFELEFDLEEGEHQGEAVLDLEAEEADTLLPADMKEDEEEFDLDFDLGPEEGTVAGTETNDSEVVRGDKTEEFDLSEIEDFLDEEPPAAGSGQTMEESAELELELESEGQTMDSETEPRTQTGGKTEEELDLETMMEDRDQWPAEEDTEISLETIDENDVLEDEERAETAPAVPAGQAAEGFQITPADEDQPPPVPETTFKRKKKSRARPFLITILVLLLLCVCAAAGLYYFGLADRVPYLKDMIETVVKTAYPDAAHPPAREEQAAQREGAATGQEIAQKPETVPEQEAATGPEAITAGETATGGEAVASANEAAPQTPSDTQDAGSEEPRDETASASPEPSGAAAGPGKEAGASSAEQSPKAGPSGKKPAAADEAGPPRIAMVENPYYRFVENQDAGQILIISGMVTNRYDTPRQSIEVKANLFDARGEVIRSSTVFAGNMLSEKELASEGLAELKEVLSSSRENRVPPGERLPFMFVFGDLPPTVAEFEVEVVSSARG